MKIEQFYDKGLAHGSYAIISKGEMALIDPARDPRPYYKFANLHQAKITAVIETHPHADFVSSHLEIAQATGAVVYVSSLVGADYPHQVLEEGQRIRIGNLTLEAIHTPGHSPDSLSILLLDEQGKQKAVFTGDTLFVGDVGRPDLRESAGNITVKRVELARMMYHSLRNKLAKLDDEVLVYPAHGPGSLCGKSMGSDLYSTIGREKKENYAFAPMSESEFVEVLLENQPYIPKYFGYDVALNKQGAPNLEESLRKVKKLSSAEALPKGAIVIDVRPEKQFKAGHYAGAFNIQNGGKFETWLGSIVGPEEPFYLIADGETVADEVVRKSAKIGYELNIQAIGMAKAPFTNTTPLLDVPAFTLHPDAYTIVDIRDSNEVASGKLFEKSLHIPLAQLRERTGEIPTDKPVVVHCAGGYRSATGSSILQAALPQLTIYDLSEAVKEFQTVR
jgi:glyoxylase-like metal-dependent hydrolase (beta-lactamase superfamily II)/rhodanese-related sulfurtransferase